MLRFLFLIVYLGFGFWCAGQPGKYAFSHLTTADGLSQSSAIAIHQDRLGQIWIGTRDGLNKYDGTEFTIYRNEEGNPKSISNNDVLAIHEDGQGNLWIGTYNGLNKYNPKTDSFTQYFHQESTDALANNTIWKISELSDGNIYLGTSGGLSVYDPVSKKFKNYLTEGLTPAVRRVMSILEMSSGKILLGTGAGVFEAKLSQDFSVKRIEGSAIYSIQDLIELKDGTVLLATQEHALIKFNPNSYRFVPFIEKETKKSQIQNIRQLLLDDNGLLWVGSYQGLILVESNESVRILQADIDDVRSLSKNSIKALFKDQKGSIWIGTYYGGINIWDPSNSNFQNITQNQFGKGLSYSVVSSIESDGKNVFFGTEGGGLNVWDREKNSFSYLTADNSVLSDNNIKTLNSLNKDELWIGTFKNGLQVYNTREKQFEPSALPPDLKKLINNVGVYAVKQDSHQNIWIGTFGKGVFKFSKETGKYQRFKHSDSKANTLSNDLIRSICTDKDNNTWIGTQKGLNKISTSGTITHYLYDEKLQYGEDVVALLQDLSNTIWVGTKSKGLLKIEGDSIKPVSIRINDVRVSAVRSILAGGSGLLWMGTNQGIVSYDSKTKAVKLYNQSDGVISNEFNDNASLKVDNSTFFFGGPNGATVISTDRLHENEYSPQVILTNFEIRDADKANANNKILEYTLPFTDDIELDYNQGNFSVSFSIPNFINSSNNTYKYRLKGLEQEWNITQTNTANYTIQKPGEYIFEVQGANNDGVWNKDITQLNIRVAPAPWRTWWAFAIYGILILIALYFLYGIQKTKAKLKHDLHLEHVEAERTKEINKSKLEFFTNISHEFRTPLSLILGPLKQIIENYQGSSKMYKKLLVVENNAGHLLKLINRLMDFRKYENNLYKLNAAEGNIVKFLREIFLSFSEYAKNGHYNFEFVCAEKEILVYYDRHKLERVFYNLISNAFRYTPKGGSIVVRIEALEDAIRINIEDSGVGVAKEFQDKIFERFFEASNQNKQDNDYTKGTGIGLAIAKSIIQLHKGTIKVEDNPTGQGSIFSVTLPLGNVHLEASEIIEDFKFSEDISQYVSQLEALNATNGDEINVKDPNKKETILVVEDNAELRQFIRDVLIQTYNVIEAENGKKAFNRAKKEAVDIIVSDVIMPEMTGTELCSKIKGDLKTSHIPIILLTSRTSLVYKLDGLERGADDYISKPFDISEFKLRVHNLLKARAKLREKFTTNDVLKPNDVIISSHDENLFKKALHIVNENIGNEDFDVRLFCSELGVSRTMLFTKIKAWSNFTPNEFILHFRMKRAAQLMEQGKLNISQISYQVGYKDPKYFSKSFQKKFGVAPSKYTDKFHE
ncbi:response regulator [Hyunsoonleella sp. SJ7]|uniref:histidine kinase n=1 Tax=Hyunsoonleella aquatilis TaxID=2762758 RepID=A0A923HAM1_9FLAO|nr:hybrid sensor histidine kinase/response regulator transcription factor [Hyunsoonleella aquatilis]MBC3759603.1 response regulator [Hyunsoonleella aquatilis]